MQSISYVNSLLFNANPLLHFSSLVACFPVVQYHCQKFSHPSRESEISPFQKYTPCFNYFKSFCQPPRNLSTMEGKSAPSVSVPLNLKNKVSKTQTAYSNMLDCTTFINDFIMNPLQVVIVTGGAGFLGQHIISILQQHTKGLREIRVFDAKPYTKKLGE